MTLTLDDEEAMSLDETLYDGIRTARVQVIVQFTDDKGGRWSAERIVKLRLKKEHQEAGHGSR